MQQKQNGESVKQEYIDLYNRLSTGHMRQDDVNQCLRMPQDAFLSMLCDGAGAQLGKILSRVEFAEIAEISKKTVYSYFASPSARDYRALTEDARIAIIWRITTKIPEPGGNAGRSGGRQTAHENKYTMRGKPVLLKNAAKMLGYATIVGLQKRIRREKLKPGDEIGHLKNGSPGATKPRLYVVNGEEMSTNRAATALGYNSSVALTIRINENNIPLGGDISHLSCAGSLPGKIYIVNGQEMNMTHAANVLGLSVSGLSRKLKSLALPSGSDISHLGPKNRRRPRPQDA